MGELGHKITSRRVITGSHLCSFCGQSDFRSASSHRIVRFLSVGDSIEFRVVCRSCLRTHRKRNSKMLAVKYNLNADQMRFFSELISRAKGRSAEIKRPFLLTLKDVVKQWSAQSGLCALTGKPMKTEPSSVGAIDRCSIDRIDSLGSYRSGNIQLVWAAVNIAKNDMRNEDFVEMCAHVTRNALNLD